MRENLCNTVHPPLAGSENRPPQCLFSQKYYYFTGISCTVEQYTAPYCTVIYYILYTVQHTLNSFCWKRTPFHLYVLDVIRHPSSVIPLSSLSNEMRSTCNNATKRNETKSTQLLLSATLQFSCSIASSDRQSELTQYCHQLLSIYF